MQDSDTRTDFGSPAGASTSKGKGELKTLETHPPHEPGYGEDQKTAAFALRVEAAS